MESMANFVCEVLLTEAPLEGGAQECDATLKVASCKLQTCATSDVDLAAGAVVDFWGVVRRLEDGHVIDGIDYEAHREMAEHQLKGVAEQAAEKFGLTLVIIHHRIDFIDGEIARRYGVITNFGKLMDPLVDKIMMAAAFISLVPLKAVPAWAATTVVARDFLVTGLRMMASAKGRILPAERLGKQKTSWQIITIIFFLALLSMVELRYANETSTWWLRAWREAGPVLVWITVALTIYSAVGFTWRNREVIAPDQ